MHTDGKPILKLVNVIAIDRHWMCTKWILRLSGFRVRFLKHFWGFELGFTSTFHFADYDFTNGTYSTWTESLYSIENLRLYLVEQESLEKLMLCLGVLLTLVSFLVSLSLFNVFWKHLSLSVMLTSSSGSWTLHGQFVYHWWRRAACRGRRTVIANLSLFWRGLKGIGSCIQLPLLFSLILTWFLIKSSHPYCDMLSCCDIVLRVANHSDNLGNHEHNKEEWLYCGFFFDLCF